MEEVTLQAVKRAMPGHGRARIHQKLLSMLGVDDQTEVEVSTNAGASLTLTVFADDLVEDGTIRISGEDLKKLDIPDGGQVRIRRKVPLDEQIKTVAGTAAEQIRGGAQEFSTKISETGGKIQKGASETADKVGTKTRELTEKVKAETKPIGEKISQAAKSSAGAIREKIPLGKLSPEIEKGLSALSPDEAKRIKSLLAGGEGLKAAVPVQDASGRTIGNLTMPPEAAIVAVQRNDKTLDVKPDTLLKKGDIIYVSGTPDAVGFVTRMLEG